MFRQQLTKITFDVVGTQFIMTIRSQLQTFFVMVMHLQNGHPGKNSNHQEEEQSICYP